MNKRFLQPESVFSDLTGSQDRLCLKDPHISGVFSSALSAIRATIRHAAPFSGIIPAPLKISLISKTPLSSAPHRIRKRLAHEYGRGPLSVARSSLKTEDSFCERALKALALIGGSIFVLAGLDARGNDEPVQPGTAGWRLVHSVDPVPERAEALPPVELADATRIETTYQGYALRLNLGEIGIVAQLSDTAFEISYMARQKGIARWFDDGNLDSVSRGGITDAGVNFQYYSARKFEGDRVIERELLRENQTDRITMWSDPVIELTRPVAPELSDGVADPAASLIQLGYLPAMPNAHPCARVAKIYDGKKRYDIEMVPDSEVILEKRRSGAIRDQLYSGPAIRCRVLMKRVAGYKDRKLAEKAPSGKIYLVELPERFKTKRVHYIPVRLEGPYGSRLEARNPTVTLGTGERINLANLADIAG